MADPRHAGLPLPAIMGLSLASFQNRFNADITVFLNSAIAQTVGVTLAGIVLGIMRSLSMKHATGRLLADNARELGMIFSQDDDPSVIIDRMAHRASLVLGRVQVFGEEGRRMTNSMFLDLQIGQLAAWLLPLMAQADPIIQEAWQRLSARSAAYFLRHKDPMLTSSDLATEAQALAIIAPKREAALLYSLSRCFTQGDVT